MSTPHRIFKTKFSSVYPHYVQKVQKKGRTKQEVDQVICWLTGYSPDGLHKQLELETDFEGFFARAPEVHPNNSLIKGLVCGTRVEEVEDPLMQRIRYLDKLVDELARKVDGEEPPPVTRPQPSLTHINRMSVGRRSGRSCALST